MPNDFTFRNQNYYMRFNAERAIRNAGAYGGEAMRRVAPEIETAIREYSRVMEWHTHNLEKSIHVDYVPGQSPKLRVRTIDYGGYQEKGFRHWISGEFIRNEFIRPAIVDNRRLWERRVAEEARALQQKRGVNRYGERKRG